MSKLVSVILCNYNGAEFIMECIESIEKQTYRNIELIIIDDGSTDDSWEKIRLIKKSSSLKIISKRKENSGLTKSLNFALNFASGDYICRQDVDDISETNRFKKCVDYIESNCVDFMLTKFTRFNNKGLIDQRPRNSWMLKNGVNINALKYGNLFCHGTFFGKASVFKELKYREEFKKAQDYDFLLRACIRNYKIGFINVPLYRLRLHEKSITASSTGEQIGFAEKALVDATGSSSYFITNKGKRKKLALQFHRLINGIINV